MRRMVARCRQAMTPSRTRLTAPPIQAPRVKATISASPLRPKPTQ